MDSNVGALKNEIAQLRRLVADLRGELGEVLTCQNDLERSFEERLDHHRVQRLFSMGHGNSDGDKTPWVMDCTVVGTSMGHGPYNGRGPHDPWTVQW